MTPDQLAAKGTESGEQKALFAWAAMAAYKGFALANEPLAYTQAVARELWPYWNPLAPVPVLKWLHAIPNGGKRDAVTAARMKAEGSRAGVADVFLPVPAKGRHGLYIELKKIKGGRASDEQTEFGAFVTAQGYHWQVCAGWREAATLIEQYLS